MITDLEDDTTPADRAFRDSADYEFRGQKLEPWSFLRKTAAMALGLKYYRLTKDDVFTIPHPLGDDRPADAPAEIEMYDGLIFDVAVVLWICHQSDTTCRRARRSRSEFEAEIDAWAEKSGIAGEHLAEATGLFMRILSDETASTPLPDSGASAGSSEKN